MRPLGVMLSKAKHLAFSGCYEDEVLRLRLIRMTLRQSLFSGRGHHVCDPKHFDSKLDPQHIEHDGKNAAGNHDGNNSRHHGGSRRVADGGGAVAALNATQATRKGDQHAVD
jgi:hypothetical protein